MINNYNGIARVYDRMAAFVFGNAFTNAQKHLLNFIPCPSRILIVGGGTGWVLEEIANIHPENVTITYVEKSIEMILLSEKRDCKRNNVVFVHSDIADFDSGDTFDVIITAFLFDNFDQSFAEKIFFKLDRSMKAGGLWLFSDFNISDSTRLQHKFLLKAMYIFFKLVCNVGASGLPEIGQYFQSAYESISTRDFYNGFICSQVYKRPVNEPEMTLIS